MDEARYFYYSNLAKYSLTNNYFLIILIIIEMYPILIDFMEAPFILKNYYNMITNSYTKTLIEPLNHIKKINIYELFRDLRREDKLYPTYILIPILSLIFIYIIFFIIFSIIDKNIKKSGIISNNSFGIYFKIILVNLYDHIFFRTASIYIYEVIISYLVRSKNYIILCITISMFSITLYLNIQYFNTFRLNIKYDLDYKYVYDGKFMFYADYFSLILKMSICFAHNVESDSLISFFIIFEFIISICSVFKFLGSNCFNLVNCTKGMLFMYFILLFLLNLIFPSIAEDNSLFYFYLILTFLTSIITTFYIRYRKMIKVIRSPVTPENNLLTQEKFELLCEYYQHSNFNYLLNQICFAVKIKTSDENLPLIQNTNIMKKKTLTNGVKSMKDNNTLLHLFLNFISNKFKEDSENVLLDKDVNLFYYIICKIYLELMTNQQNNFFLLFETRNILLRLKKTNLILYYDLNFFYELLCEQYSLQNNVNFLIYNDSFYKLYDSIKIFISEYQNFINKRNFLKTKNFINMGKVVSEFFSTTKKNFEILSSSSYKDDYQRILFRIILEGLLNLGITRDPTSMILINEEISIYEEMLDKQYHSEKHLKIIVDLKQMKSRIIKIGKELNLLWDKNIDSMFPSQFIHIAKKQFYYDYDTQIQNIGNQVFKFFIWDNDENLKQFLYVYKIYPKIKEDIAYLDGYFQLGNEPLLITEKDLSSNQENIILTSKALQNCLYINQYFIDTLEKFQYNINLNSFISSSQNCDFHLKAYSKYLNNVSNKLLNMCRKEELEILSPIIEEIKKLGYKNLNHITYQFINFFSITDDDISFQKEYKIYTLRQVKNKKAIKDQSATKLDWDFDYLNWITTQNMVSSVINGFDSNSVSSIQKGLNILAYGLNNKKRNNSEKQQNNNNLIIIIFNLLVIFLAIVALVYENYLNNTLLEEISFYKSVYSFNRLILNTMFGYYSFLCYVKNNGEKCLHEMIHYLNDIGLPELYTFNQYEHELKISYLSERFKGLKDKVANSEDEEIRNFLTFKKGEIHLIYENNILKNEKTSNESFSYLMESFINKLLVTSNSDDFQSANIYPIIVDENFQPINLINNDDLEELGNTQIYIYEIMISYLDYSNFFYGLQKSIEKKINKQIKGNKSNLITFIFFLIFSNILIVGICFYFFKKFKIIVNNKLQSLEILLKNEENIKVINKKIQIISIIFKFYKQNPIKLIKKLGEKMRMKNNKKKEINNNSFSNIKKEKEDYEIKMIKEKIYDLSFIINPFFLILTILIIIYAIYSFIFLEISNNSFSQLFNICQIIEISSYSCLQYSLELGIIQLYQFVKIPEKTLYNTLWAFYNNKTNEEGNNAFVDLLNIIQDTMQKEKSLKELESSIDSTDKIISLECSTLYSNIKDERFSIIFKEHNEFDYEHLLIQYCNTIPSLKYKNEDLLLEDLTYSMMKLLLINYNNKNNIPYYIPSELFSVTLKFLELYRPLKLYLGDYYFRVLDSQTDSHFNILLIFLLGNIILEVVYFLIIKIKIIDKIEAVDKNLDKILLMIKCVNF